MPTVMLVLRPFVSATVTDTPTHHEPFAVRRMPTTLLPPLMRFPDIEAPAGTPRNVWLIAYAPNNHITEKLINRTLLSVNTIYFPSMNDSVPFYAAQGKTAGRRLLNSTTYAFTHIYISVGERGSLGQWGEHSSHPIDNGTPQSTSPRLHGACKRRPGCICLRNDLYCVGWGVKLYSLTRSPSYRHPHRKISIRPCYM